MRFIQFLSSTSVLAAFISLSAAAAPSLDELRAQASDYVENVLGPIDMGKREIAAANLDPRIQVRSCASGMVATSQAIDSTSRYVNVHLQCPDNGWNLYVPVKIRHLLPTVVTTRSISQGDILDEGDLRVAFREKHLLRGEPIDSVDHFVGSKARKRIGNGQPITDSKICLVCKGESVTIIASAGGLELKTRGEALSNGNFGDSVTIRNRDSGRVIDALVSANGVVKIYL